MTKKSAKQKPPRRPAVKKQGKHTIISTWVPAELRVELEKIREATGKPFGELVRESLLERYGKNMEMKFDDLAGYIPPPLDEELKWVAERHKALLDRLAKELDDRIRDINKRVQRALKKKKLSIEDCINLADFKRPEQTFKEIIEEWDAETRKRIEEPSTNTIAQRYIWQVEMLLQWVLDRGVLPKLADQFPYRCKPRHWFGHAEYGKFACFAMERAILSMVRWREVWRAAERADEVDPQDPEEEVQADPPVEPEAEEK